MKWVHAITSWSHWFTKHALKSDFWIKSFVSPMQRCTDATWRNVSSLVLLRSACQTWLLHRDSAARGKLCVLKGNWAGLEAWYKARKTNMRLANSLSHAKKERFPEVWCLGFITYYNPTEILGPLFQADPWELGLHSAQSNAFTKSIRMASNTYPFINRKQASCQELSEIHIKVWQKDSIRQKTDPN